MEEAGGIHKIIEEIDEFKKGILNVKDNFRKRIERIDKEDKLYSMKKASSKIDHLLEPQFPTL